MNHDDCPDHCDTAEMETSLNSQDLGLLSVVPPHKISVHSYMECSRDLSDIPEEEEDPPFSFCSSIFKEEIKTNMMIAFPVILTNLLQYSLLLTTTAFAGRLSALELEGTVLGLSLVQAFGWTISIGMISSCDTMMSQAFGSDSKKRTGLFLQRGILVLNLVPLILWALHVNFEPILIALRQDPDISRVTSEFIIYFIPGIMFQINYMLLARFMQNQGRFLPSVVAALLGNVFNICAQLLFVSHLRYGFRAAAVCFSLSFAVMFVAEAVYIVWSGFYKVTWPGLQWEAFYDWAPMVHLGLAGVAHTSFEVIVWEASVFMAGLLGKTELAACSLILQVTTFIFMTYMGSGIASNIRVGQCLGANRPNLAKTAYRAGIVVIGFFTVILSSLIIIFNSYIPYIFTDKVEVVELVTAAFPSVYLLLFSDPFSAVCVGSVRGCGRQMIGAAGVFLSFYCCSIPTSIILAFVFDFGIQGIWIGNSVGSVICVAFNFLVLEFQNWDKQAVLARRRIAFSTFQKLENNSENDEDKALLFEEPFNKEALESSAETLSPRHIRTSSHPIGCSTEFVLMPPSPSNLPNLNRMILRRGLYLAAALLLLITAILIHSVVPTSLYRPVNTTEI